MPFATPFMTDADVVFHLAAQADVATSIAGPVVDAEVNVARNRERAGGGPRADASVVFASTGGAIYGGRRARDRGSHLLPVSPYGIAKSRPRSTSTGGTGSTGQPCRAPLRERLRAASDRPRSKAAWSRSSSSGSRPGSRPRSSGTGRSTRDFVLVDDVVRALLLAAEHDGGVFNVGTGVGTTIAELHRLCEQAFGVDAPPSYGPPRAGDARRSVLDTTHATADLGFTASMPLAEGIAATAAT